MTKIEMEAVELGVAQQAPLSLLKQLHQRVDALSSVSNFSKGWDVINKGNSKEKRCFNGTVTVIATLLTEAYGGFEIYFGALALKQGIKDLKENGKASIIGHPSEWMNTGLLLMSLPIVGPYNEVSAVGNRKQVEQIYKIFLDKAKTEQQQRVVYDDYLEVMPSRSQPYYLFTVHLPRGLPKQYSSRNRALSPALSGLLSSEYLQTG